VEERDIGGISMNEVLPSVNVAKAPWLSPRLALRVALLLGALILGLLSAFHLQHKCALGEKWFENNAPWALPVLYGTLALAPRRVWVAALLVAFVFVLFSYVFTPWYLMVIHPHGEA
jgi:hypothetical protein